MRDGSTRAAERAGPLEGLRGRRAAKGLPFRIGGTAAGETRTTGFLDSRAVPALSVALLVALAVSMVLAIGIGSVPLAPETVRDVVVGKLLRRDEIDGVPGHLVQIVWELRAPRVVLAAIVGAGLSVVGVAMQALVRNPLADPYVLGASSGASVGATIVILFGSFGLGSLGISAAALVSSAMAMGIVYLIAQQEGRLTPVRLVLSGVVIGYVLSAITSFLVFWGDPRAAQQVLFWLLGGLGRARWPLLWLPGLALAVVALRMLMSARQLDVLHAGDEAATTLGVSVPWRRAELFVISALLTGLLVAVSGAVGFVGLIIPHITRLLVGRPAPSGRADRGAVRCALHGLGRRPGPVGHGAAGDSRRRPDGDHRGASVPGVDAAPGPRRATAGLMRIDVEALRVRIGSRLLIEGLDLTIEAGRCVGLVGPNGSGKSTLIKAVSRVLRPVSGRVLLDGSDILGLSGSAAARQLAVLAQESPGEIEMTVSEMVMLGRLPHQRAFDWASSEDVAIAHAAMRTAAVAHLAGRGWQTLSGGEKQRALLARALAQQSAVLLLDEPTNHLDVRHQLALLSTVRRLGATTVAALHDLNLAASHCDQVIVLSDGAVVAFGPPDAVLVDEVLAPVFHVHVDPVTHPRTGRVQLVFSPIDGDAVAPVAPPPVRDVPEGELCP